MKKKSLVFLISKNNIEYVKKAILEIQNIEIIDLLIIDEGSDYEIIEYISEFEFVKSISHNEELGFGACINSAIKFSKDFDYEYLICINPEYQGFIKDLPNIISNLDYGYDIVICSRILENSNYSKIDESIIIFFEELTEYINSVTDLNITDPLTDILGFNISSIKEIDLTVENHGVLLQLFIQSSYYGYNIIEIPSESLSSFGEEITSSENSLADYITIIETEKYLYNKGSIN